MDRVEEEEERCMCGELADQACNVCGALSCRQCMKWDLCAACAEGDNDDGFFDG